MSQLPAGPPSGNNNPSRPSPSPDQAAACPLVPFLAAAAGPQPLPTAIITAGESFPWPVQSRATQAFNITGCITDLVFNSRNNIEWICPQVIADRTDGPGGPGAVTKMTGQTALMHTWPAGGGTDGVTFQRIVSVDGQLRDCISPQQGQPTLPAPGQQHTCAQCPASSESSPIQRAPLAPVEPGTYYLHGCMSAGDRKVCSWLDLPLGVPCLARGVVSGGFTCDQSSQRMPTVDGLHSTLMSMRRSGGGTTMDPPVGPVVVDARSPTGIEDGAGSRRWVFIAVPLLAFVGGLALGAAFLIYRRRRTERDQHSTQAVPYTPAPLPTHYNAPQAATTPALAPIPLPTYSSGPVPYAPAATPHAAQKPIPAPPASLPRPMDMTGLSLIPLLPVPAAESASTAESLQSLTDAWESLFIRLEHECTQAARAALPGASIAVVRADRNHRIAKTMAQVWTALSTGASAGENGGLAEGMRAVMARMSAAYPTFELLGVPGAGVEVRADAMVEYAAGLTGVGAEVRRVVKGMVWPGWFDRSRQVVVVKARVVME